MLLMAPIEAAKRTRFMPLLNFLCGLLSQPSGKLRSNDGGIPLEHFTWLLHQEPSRQAPELAVSGAPAVGDDMPLVRRVMRAYAAADAEYAPSASFWDHDLRMLKLDIHNALSTGDEVEAAQLLRNPAETTHFWGFDAICKAPPGQTEPHQFVIQRLNSSVDWKILYALWLQNAVFSLAEAVGARRVTYPEIDPKEAVRPPSVEDVLDVVATTMKVDLVFPNPYPGELGLKTKRGIVGFRALQAVYQAYRIAQLMHGRPNAKILEIGAGLGRTAYFAHQFGITNYTIVDIPLTGAAQGYFLGRTLGAANVRLSGEDNNGSARVKNAFALQDENFDLIVNIDSLTEMSEDTSSYYWEYIQRNTKLLLSINHEFNPKTIQNFYSSKPGITATRYPYWMRKGYVEEVVIFP